MTTAPETPKPNRRPWIIVGVLGCLVVCLLFAVVAAAGYFILAPQLTPVAVGIATPTRVPFGLPSSTPAAPQPTSAPVEPTKAPAQPTRAATQTTGPGDVVGIPPTTAPGDVSGVPTKAATAPTAPTRPPASPTTVAPKGKIAFSRCEGTCDLDGQKTVWLMNADGSDAKKILDKASEPAIHPDGTKIAYYHWSDGIFAANMDGSNPKKIVGDTFTESVQWSHDGRWLAFGTRPSAAGNIAIDVVAPDGTNRHGMIVGRSPFWSPDDTQVVFNTCRGGCGIFKASSGGGDAIPVVTDDGGLPAWSPDGKKILYHKDADGQKQIFVINPDGSGKKQLTSGAMIHVAANWSLDGNFIFYRSPEGGTWGIWRMNADGTNPIKLIDNVPPVEWAFERLAVGK